MSQDVIEIVRGMDAEKIETQLVLQCAPLIVGLKMSNLFIIHNRHLRKMHRLLRGSKICYYVLYVSEEKSTVLLYNPKKLTSYLTGGRVKKFLEEAGYQESGLEDILFVFRDRYQKYRMGQRKFPHELGLLLGYPLEDVEGFIQNRGRNFLYTGYWKVYENVSAKKDLFRMYELAKETLIELVSNGVSIADIIDAYSGNVL